MQTACVDLEMGWNCMGGDRGILRDAATSCLIGLRDEAGFCMARNATVPREQTWHAQLSGDATHLAPWIFVAVLPDCL